MKKHEAVTNHDVKAVEYYVKDELKKIGMEDWAEWVHFGLTSEDVNCTATPLSLRDFMHEIFLPKLSEPQCLRANCSEKLFEESVLW